MMPLQGTEIEGLHMPENTETLTLAPSEHDVLGIIHCGVTREGFIAVGGEPRDIDDGEEILLERVSIKTWREVNEYTFTRVNRTS